MSIPIPLRFRAPWQSFFNSILPGFMGYNSYAEASPIAQGMIDGLRLFFAFLIVWVIVRMITELYREFFG